MIITRYNIAPVAVQPDSDPASEPLLTPIAPAPGQQPSNGTDVLVPIDSGTAFTGGLLPDWSFGEWAAYSGIVLLALFLTAIATTTLWWMLHAWRSADDLRATQFSASPRPARHRFTLLVPGRHEEEVMGQTLDRLAQQDHPDFEIIAIVGHDDPGTELVVREAAARNPHLIKVVVDDSVPKNKPKALNRALQIATGDVVGVFDAEDEVHPGLLTVVDSKFQETGADVVQGGVQLMNFETSWWSLRNVLEYYFWFRSRLHFHARSKFIPLGGNTVFVTRERLEWSKGWDDQCLAEDCELGVRLSSDGAKVVVAYNPEYVTREETPPTLKSLYKQRTRWNQGFLQVLGKGEWKKLPTLRQRMYARYMLNMPFLQAATGLLIPISIAFILLVKVPTAVALITFLPLIPTVITLVVEAAGLTEFGRIYDKKVRMRDYTKLILGLVPYQIFLAAAAVRSVVRQLRGDGSWEKTEHTGAHRDAAVAPESTAVPVLATAGASETK
ncbi:glycosyltransferase family 2 protein [Microbacterium marmarense]|uniref:Glycosyltransferase family 2 protein n=1 Tax=Microbacterium marmarense TaxID=3122051 RepID=A0ABU8LSR3_9MICO